MDTILIEQAFPLDSKYVLAPRVVHLYVNTCVLRSTAKIELSARLISMASNERASSVSVKQKTT